MATKHLTPIKTVAAYEMVADQIQRAVHLGLLVPGDRLPPERALAEQLGVARMTVRDAIRVLVHEGWITVRRGAHGGMWIKAHEVTKRELQQLAADTDRAIGDVFHFRELVEGEAARLAAERARPKDIKKLRELTASMQKTLEAHLKNPDIPTNVPRFFALDSQFHGEIVRIADNPYLIDAVEKSLAARYTPFGTVLRTLTPHANDGHEEMVDAMAAQDGRKAEQLMRAHIQGTRKNLMSILSQRIRAQTGS